MRPDDPVVRLFLARSLVARLATRSRRDVPALTPLWFVVDGGRLVFATGRDTRAARNVAAHPDVAILLDGEARAGGATDVLRLRGRAAVRDGLPGWRALLRIALKYYLSPGGARCELANAGRWGLRRRYYAQGRAAVIEVAPESAELLRRPG